MEKKVESVTPSPPPSVGDYEDSRSTYTVDSPPPAYQKLELPSVKVTKIVAATLLLVTLLAGLTAVAIVYMQHNLKCAHSVESQQQKFFNELPQASKIVQEKPGRESSRKQSTKEKVQSKSPSASEVPDSQRKLNFPIHIDLDDITGKLVEKNQRARLNCVIEKKRSEEIIPKTSKTLQTPFGNVTTDPKFTHITGETMSLTCRSGNERVSSIPTADGSAENAPPIPILIRIPVQNDMIPPPAAGLRLLKPKLPLSRMNPLINLIRPPIASVQPPSQSNLPQLLISPSQRVNVQGPISLHQMMPNLQQTPPPQPVLPSHEQAEQQHQQPNQPTPPSPQQQQQQPPQMENPLQRLFSPFQSVRIPFLPFPQLNFQQMIPHLIEVHKQIQMQREKVQQQKDNQSGENKLEQRQDHEDDEHEEHPKGPAVLHRDGPVMMHEPRESMILERSHPPHVNHMQRLPMEPAPPMGNFMPSHPMERMHHPLPGPVNMRPQEHPDMIRGHPNPEEMHQQEARQHMERAGVDINVEGPPGIHNNQPNIMPPPEEMMFRDGPPLPVFVRSHNMQPRSSANFRVKRMTGACSCVCK